MSYSVILNDCSTFNMQRGLTTYTMLYKPTPAQNMLHLYRSLPDENSPILVICQHGTFIVCRFQVKLLEYFYAYGAHSNVFNEISRFYINILN